MNTKSVLRPVAAIPSLLVGIGILATFLSSASAASRAWFQIRDLGPAPFTGGIRAQALNTRGDVVGLVVRSNGLLRPALFCGGNITELPFDESVAGGYGFDINDSGEIIGHTTAGQNAVAFLLTSRGLINLTEQVGGEINLFGVNNSGVIAANLWEGLRSRPVTWSNGVLRELRPLGTIFTGVADINNRGDVLVRYYSETAPGAGYAAALIKPDDTVDLLGNFFAIALNDRRHIVGDQSEIAFLCQPRRSRSLGPLPGDLYSEARKINFADQIIGESEDANDRKRPFFYSGGKMHDPNDLIHRGTGWTIVAVDDINDRGQIVGIGLCAGQTRSILLTPTKGRRDANRRP